ncbi:hypothetical protein T492DRAFT_52143 [Pavlovales sp. CCMP2436]|nr:hypothetical protein T492DRAFT_52143 [Pavlovales sp. CCMP2436]|mmetsp:Transcript_22611/g.57393  ORF Transcript_22611/g.57393 Transcript_22611/m.57393 type:complete len:220 (-) Transcript_22611:110-769(-)
MADALAVNDRLIYPIINQYRRLTVTAEASSSRVHRFVFVDSRSIERADRESWRLLVQEAALIAAEARALLEELADRAFLWRGAWDVRERAARGGAAPRRVEVPALERRLAACIRGLMHVRGLLLVLVLLLLVLLQLLLLLRRVRRLLRLLWLRLLRLRLRLLRLRLLLLLLLLPRRRVRLLLLRMRQLRVMHRPLLALRRVSRVAGALVVGCPLLRVRA